MAKRSFIVTATSSGVLCSPPDATMNAIGLPTYANGGRLYSPRLRVQNIGGEIVTLKTKADYAPAAVGEATLEMLQVYPGQEVILNADPGDAMLDLGYGTHFFYAFSASVTNSDIIVEAV